jgi:hypothetical protein
VSALRTSGGGVATGARRQLTGGEYNIMGSGASVCEQTWRERRCELMTVATHDVAEYHASNTSKSNYSVVVDTIASLFHNRWRCERAIEKQGVIAPLWEIIEPDESQAWLQSKSRYWRQKYLGILYHSACIATGDQRYQLEKLQDATDKVCRDMAESGTELYQTTKLAVLDKWEEEYTTGYPGKAQNQTMNIIDINNRYHILPFSWQCDNRQSAEDGLQLLCENEPVDDSSEQLTHEQLSRRLYERQLSRTEWPRNDSASDRDFRDLPEPDRIKHLSSATVLQRCYKLLVEMADRSEKATLALQCQIHVRKIGVEGWDGTPEGKGKYENEDSLEQIFSQFGCFVQATVRHRVKDGANSSWALVAMADRESVARALAATEEDLRLGATVLQLSRFDPDCALTSDGKMRQMQAAQTSRFQKRLAIASAPAKVEKAKAQSAAKLKGAASFERQSTRTRDWRNSKVYRSLAHRTVASMKVETAQLEYKLSHELLKADKRKLTRSTTRLVEQLIHEAREDVRV